MDEAFENEGLQSEMIDIRVGEGVAQRIAKLSPVDEEAVTPPVVQESSIPVIPLPQDATLTALELLVAQHLETAELAKEMKEREKRAAIALAAERRRIEIECKEKVRLKREKAARERREAEEERRRALIEARKRAVLLKRQAVAREAEEALNTSLVAAANMAKKVPGRNAFALVRVSCIGGEGPGIVIPMTETNVIVSEVRPLLIVPEAISAFATVCGDKHVYSIDGGLCRKRFLPESVPYCRVALRDEGDGLEVVVMPCFTTAVGKEGEPPVVKSRTIPVHRWKHGTPYASAKLFSSEDRKSGKHVRVKGDRIVLFNTFCISWESIPIEETEAEQVVPLPPPSL